MAGNASRTAKRYALLQIPAALVLGAALVVATNLQWIGAPLAVGLFALWIVKDVVVYPLVKRAYEVGEGEGARGLVGRIARAREDLAPHGYVLLAGELWKAEAVASDAPIRAGERVRIEAADGLRLRVSRVHGDDIVRST